MDFATLARQRHSVLQYDPARPLEDAVLEAILQAGRAAPTACNRQPQRVLVLRSAAQKEKVAQVTHCSLYFDTALLVCCDRTACWVRPCDGKASGEIDASIAATHMMLQATDLGVGSIWVMSWDPARLRESFALDEAIEPVALLILGYPTPGEQPRPGHFARKPLEEFLL